ncbi:MAG: ABC transporter permease [Bacteroidales bacterium]|nr:ABC transporter permease [Bacteroidales bacterium]
MRKFFSIVYKEYLQLIRDLPGLTILFLMPAVMLVVITLTQEKVLIGRESGMKIIIVNADASHLGNRIESELKANISFKLVTYTSQKEAEHDVFSGKYQMMVVIPEGSTERLLTPARLRIQDTSGGKKTDEQAGIIVMYDPAVMKIYKDMLVSSLQLIIESTAQRLFMEKYSEELKSDIAQQIANYKKQMLLIDLDDEIPDFPYRKQVMQQIQSAVEKKAEEPVNIKFPVNPLSYRNLVKIEETSAGNSSYDLKPDIIKNNVPAFILFAMFFIVLPLAGSIIHEKQQGTKDRVLILPVSGFTIFSGKILVYLIICILQFLLMIGIGRFIIPLISHLPPLTLNVDLLALVVIVIASGLAAIGFGLLIGTFSNTYGQAAPLGSVIVVILAIMGGIFVPAFMMPDIIRKISIISPMRWGTDAFFSIFARGAGVKIVLPQLLPLLIFFGISLLLSANAFSKQK